MRIFASLEEPPSIGDAWSERWEGPDRGAYVSWARGVEKAKESPELASAALRGELPILPWRGGVDRPLKTQEKLGSINYLAMWLGLRYEPLDLVIGDDVTLRCSKHGVQVRFVWDLLEHADALREDESDS